MVSTAVDRNDGLSSSTAVKGPCRVATTANITLSGEQTINGIAVVTDDRVLVKDQTIASQNGIYVADTGPWRRAKDFAGNKDVRKGTRVWITDGTGSPTEYAVTTANPIVIGTTGITFAQSYLGGTVGTTGLQLLAAGDAITASRIVVGDTHIDVEARYKTGSLTDTQAAQAAFDNAPIGAILHFKPRQWSFTSTLTMSKVQKIDATGAAMWALSLTATQLLEVKIQSTGYGTTNGREFGIRGGNWYAPTCDHAVFMKSTTGASGSSDNATGYPLLNAIICEGIWESSLGAIRIRGVDNHFIKIDKNAINSGVFIDLTGDGNQVTNNIIAGTQPGVYINLVSGAFNTLVSGNAIVGSGGGVDVENGDMIVIENNQFEQSASGSASPKSHVTIRGAARIARNNRILRNNFGGGAYIDTNITIFNGRYNLIDENQFNVATVQDINFSSSAGAGSEANYNVVGSKNGYRGTRTKKVPSSNTGTDVGRRLTINDQGYGNRGVWKSATQFLAFANSWSAGTAARFMVDEIGFLRFAGPWTNGTLLVTTKVGTLPVGHRPEENVVVPFPSDGGATKTMFLNASTGDMTLNEAQLGTNSYPSAMGGVAANYMDTYETGP